MKVKDVIKKLLDYNLEAEFEVLAHNRMQPYSFGYGGAEGCTKQSCDSVSVDCDDLNQNESAG